MGRLGGGRSDSGQRPNDLPVPQLLDEDADVLRVVDRGDDELDPALGEGREAVAALDMSIELGTVPSSVFLKVRRAKKALADSQQV